MTQNVSALTDQWNDFLLRQYDPYAMAKYELLMNWMGNFQGKSVLVVGCGSGEFCAFLANKGARVFAIDIEQRNIDLAQETAKKLGATFKTWVQRLEGMGETEKYDYVVATDVIEHIPDDLAAMRKLRALIKDDGRLVLTVPALQALMGYHDEILGHFRRYSISSMKKLMGSMFEPINLRYFGFFLIPITLLVSKILRRPYPVAAVGQATSHNTWLNRILKLFFKTEQKINFGLGTSLMLVAKPAKNHSR